MATRRETLRFAGTGIGADLVAGITVAIVALPLALGFGITAGAGPASGLATAIVAGFIAAVAGSSRFQVSGPTGAMTVVLVPIIANLGIGALVPLGIMAGVMVILAGLFKLGRLIDTVPWSVMEGFTLGIALVIAWQQIDLIAPFDVVTVGVVLLTLALKFTWSAFHRRNRWTRAVPASAVAVIVVSIVSVVADFDTPRIGSLPASDIFVFPTVWPTYDIAVLIGPALSIAILAALESLLAARVADSLAHSDHPDEHPVHDPNRELVGQGLATLGSAFVGGMPATGAIARTAVNVHAGARSRWAAAIHAVVLLVFVVALAPLVSQIPVAVLAGVLLGTSWRIANPRTIRENLHTTWPNIVSYLVTAVAVFALGLIEGTVIGIAVYLLANRLSRTTARAREEGR